MKLADMWALHARASKAPWTAEFKVEPLSPGSGDVIRRSDGVAILANCCCGGFVRPDDEDFVVKVRSLYPKLLEFVGQAEHAAQQLACHCDWNPETKARDYCCERCWILEAKSELEKDT